MDSVILIGGSHVNLLGLIRSIGSRGYKVIALLEPSDVSSCTLRFSKYISELVYLRSLEETLDFLRNRHSDTSRKIPVLCGSDYSMCLLDAHFDELSDRYKFFNVRSMQGGINHFMDKDSTFALAKKCGIKLIPTWLLQKGDAIPDAVTFPCFIKGNNSKKFSKALMRVCNNREELNNSLQSGVNYLVQEYIEKDCEVNLNGIAYNGGKDVYLPGVVVKVRESLVRMGEYMRLDHIGLHQGLNVEGIRRFIRELGYEGLFGIDLLKKGDSYYFLEVNLRNDALNYIYTAAGVNLPAMWVDYAMGRTLQNESVNMIKYPFYVMAASDFWNPIEGKVSWTTWIREFLMSNAYFTLNLTDPLPGCYLVYFLIKSAIRKVLLKFFRTMSFSDGDK